MNNQHSSISLIEKTSKKLLPIYQELLRKISAVEKKRLFNKQGDNNAESSDEESAGEKSEGKPKRAGSKKLKQDQSKTNVLRDRPFECDLRHILGFLNQTEWIQNLNIGNIMQITPMKLEDLSQLYRNEDILNRESFLEVISFLIVGYFCASTEIRFIIQLKDEIPKFHNFQIEKMQSHSEFWHTISLDVACSFLPSDCPLLNHILLSY